MSTIKIKVDNYYGIPSYYSVMPPEIFDALETASLNNEEYAFVDKLKFDTMLFNHQAKYRFATMLN